MDTTHGAGQGRPDPPRLRTYTLCKNTGQRGEPWLITSTPPEGGKPVTLGSYKTRKSALVVGRLLAGRSSRIVVEA